MAPPDGVDALYGAVQAPGTDWRCGAERRVGVAGLAETDLDEDLRRVDLHCRSTVYLALADEIRAGAKDTVPR
jgi:hypothetical protein